MIQKPKQICYLFRMRKISFLVLAFCLLVNNAFAAPLVFSATKEISVDDLSEIATIDVAKYRQVRIAVKVSLKDDPGKYSVEFTRLTGKRAELRSRISELTMTLKSNHPDVTAKQRELDDVDKRLEEIGKIYDENSPSAVIEGVEAGEIIPLVNLDENKIDDSVLIDTPPTKIRISVKGRGVYRVFVWGQ